jgi:CheY-like chemotaxis protein
LTIITNNKEISAKEAQLIGIALGEYVEVTVADTGIGMTPETMARAFDPFFTTKSAGAGTGLGLSQVYGFAVQSGGGVLLESKAGEGTTICLLLPRARGVAVSRERGAALCSTIRGKATILVVEDDADVREFAVNVITGLGYDVVEAENSESAEAILHGRRDIAAVVTDVVMPGSFDGLELAERIARRSPRIPVLVTTGYATRAQDRVRAAGAALLPKPYRASALAAAVQSLARAESAYGTQPQRASA